MKKYAEMALGLGFLALIVWVLGALVYGGLTAITDAPAAGQIGLAVLALILVIGLLVVLLDERTKR